jgi:hypothetical protein
VKAATFLLAEAATIREGTLNILGAGINILRRPAYPALLGLPLALLLEFIPEGEGDHEVHIGIEGQPGLIADVVIELAQAPPGEVKNLAAYFPIVIPTQSVILPRPGRYVATLKIDGAESARFEFEAGMLPPDDYAPLGDAGAPDLTEQGSQ